MSSDLDYKERLRGYLKDNNELVLNIGVVQMGECRGEGGNSLVYAGTMQGEKVALKFLIQDDDSKKARFIAEYLNVQKLPNSPGIVRYVTFDCLRLDNDHTVPVIVMKLYDSSLKHPWPEEAKNEQRFLQIFNFLRDTLDLIHQSGIIHRDIKPENILVDGDELVLTDFGIAAYDPAQFLVRADTETGELLRNRLFSAPEQENDGVNAHETMDIYAMGQVLHWYVNGQPHRGTGRSRISNIFPKLGLYDAVIDKCLQHEPSQRFQSIKEITEFIRQSSLKPYSFYLNIFNEICRSNFPKTEKSLASSNDVQKIDRLLLSLQTHIPNLDRRLWFTDGLMENSFDLSCVKPGVWRMFSGGGRYCYEYVIDEVWVRGDSGVTFNDYVLIHYTKGSPFDVNGEDRWNIGLVDETYQIEHSEYVNGYAEIDGAINDLSERDAIYVERMESPGFIFFSTVYDCVLVPENVVYVVELLQKLEHEKPTIELLDEFSRIIRRKKHPEVLENL